METVQIPVAGGDEAMRLASEAFDDGARIPVRYVATGAGGDNTSPPLSWTDAPEGTQSFAITVIDHHPVAREFVHWAVVGVAPETMSIPEGASGSMTDGTELEGTSGGRGWHGPRPPEGSGPHPYEFTVWALAAGDVDPGLRPTAADLERALRPASLQSASITGYYER